MDLTEKDFPVKNEFDIDNDYDQQENEPRIDVSYYLDLGIEFPDYSTGLCKIIERIDRVKSQVFNGAFRFYLNKQNYFTYYDKIIDYLEYVGQLSVPIFEAENRIEELYILKYRHDPAFAKKLWYQHYADLHRPYTTEKNKCYRILTALDKRYQKKFGKLPIFKD